MASKIEVGLLRKLANKDKFESVIIDLVKRGKFHSNSIIYFPSQKFEELNEFEVYCITIDDIKSVS